MALATTATRLEIAELAVARDVTAKITHLIGAPNELLLVGGTASLVDALHARGWQVVWVTEQASVATAAASEHIGVLDLEDAGWVAQIDAGRFSTAVAVGLFEFARDPATLLRALGAILPPSGQLVALFPNIAHGSLRLALLYGHFPYASWDQPEQVPLRFFTWDAIVALFASAGLEIRRIERRQEGIDFSHTNGETTAISAEMAHRLAHDPDALTSHFVVLAGPKDPAWNAPMREESNAGERVEIELIPRIERQAEQLDALADQIRLLQSEVQTRLLETPSRYVTSVDAHVVTNLQSVRNRLTGLGSAQHPWWLNRRSTDPHQVMEYHRLIHRVRGCVRAIVPPKSIVLVVSRGDDALLELGGPTAWHFPMTEDGIYAGHHPADSAEAINHLEQLRTRGAAFLVIPATASWWLEHYSEFVRFLEHHYRVAARCDESCVIFDLREA